MFSLQAFKRSARYQLIRAGLEGTDLALRTGLPLSAAHRSIIFAMHHVDPAPVAEWTPNAWLTITPKFLDETIQTVLAQGFTPLALEDLPERLSDARDSRRYVCFTLDDGYRDNARHAAPVFQRHGVPYTLFITAGFVERSRSIWWKTAQELALTAKRVDLSSCGIEETLHLDGRTSRVALFDRLSNMITEAEDEDAAVAMLDTLARQHGMDPRGLTERLTMDAAELSALAEDRLARFGAHTLTHANLRKVSDKRLRSELTESAERLSGYVGAKPTTFAYPYGYPAAVGGREVTAAGEAGFAAAVTTQPGLLTSGSKENFAALPRVSLNGFYQRQRYVRALLSGLPFRLAFRKRRI
ncbi:polysaccharide deacetylase family protein [Nitratireductor sp. GISD-1A_MAKvit]|uniref:polysaccharide deacetylase family protein n=1 Tax=Nitratireductor sp. GISD-1A_MAKvit TaxID=3234198 RepID=UPI0034665C5D